MDRKSFEAKQHQAASFEFLTRDSRTLAQAAIQFVLQQPGVSTTIPRALTVCQLEQIARATALPALTPAELERIRLVGDGDPNAIRGYPYRSRLPGPSG